ncbi:unnamed protein product [Rotaria socialis]|uniref:NAD(P)(+)--arginine ADP-ribosyltransferase n=1 Tax=Rotaria socialis TaxID=392032 RepID=A0A821VCN5_9BILA|nr:unnamed protein product [Rotaria socialis]CAF4903911.1 unnamed protein product [Rotaria socialis]
MSALNKCPAMYGLISLGKSGVGKSFIANRLLNRDSFESNTAAGPVTKLMSFSPYQHEKKQCIVYDVPCLLNISQEVMKSNREEIKKAFEHSLQTIVLFIVGEQSGRISEEDITTITLINDAYKIPHESLVLIVNSVPKDMTDDYRNKIITQFVKLFRVTNFQWSANASGEPSISRRAANLDAEPGKILPPIRGYANQPLVSLEEAVLPLQCIMPNIESNVWIVKQNLRNPKDGLTVDESASIMLYTYESISDGESLSYILNETLNSKNRKQLVPWYLYLRLLLTALDHLPAKECTVFRKTKRNLIHQYPNDKVITWWGFSSCTSSMDTPRSAPDFDNDETHTQFVIQCHKGRNIKNHSFEKTADEILLLPATQFVVTMSVKANRKLNLVHLQEQSLSFPLLEPVQAPNRTKNSAQCFDDECQPPGIKSKFPS